jgi:Carboxypeptidase regulatory-like domain
MFESMRRVFSSTASQSGFEAFWKRYSFARAMPKLAISLQHRRSLRAILICTLLLLTFTEGKGQSGGATGTIVGTVIDSTGALIAGAQVSITESDTNVTTQTITSSSGGYAVASLKPGTYRVTVMSSGFSTITVLKVGLAVGSVQRIDLKLAPGSVQQNVSVNAEAVGLDTENAAIGQIVTGDEIVDLPLNGRNFAQLLLLNSGGCLE